MGQTRLTDHRSSHSLTGPFLDAAKRVVERVREVESRRGLRRMRGLEHRLLDDIGVTRDDVEWALKLPWNRRAGAELQRLARRRRAANLLARGVYRRV